MVRFECAFDPTTNEPISKLFSKNDLKDIYSIETFDSNPDMYEGSLFKLAAK